MSEQQRRAVTEAAWRLIVLATLGLAPGWDALGLLVGGNAAYTSHAYDVLRALTPWGMRGYGPLLGLLCVTTVYAYGRWSAGSGTRGYRLLRYCLSLLAGWYVLWTVGLVGAWYVHWQIYSWGVSKVLLVAVLFLILARTTPPEHARG
ncbi:hypothetical protein AB0F93_00020 [Micromonospora tulbaghiae]|uniref:hypothetical protein n=1 Tax=Micromonospora tulbaghiae TaxID=479978 RepID=UPI00333080E7